MVTSAGNANASHDLFRYYPARNSRVLSVGATERDTRRRAGFSNYGKLVNVFAPGVDILTIGSDNGYISIRVAADAPANQRVRFFARIRDGTFEDGTGMLPFRVIQLLEPVHRSLSAFYTATGGDNWTRNDNWDIKRVPSEEELATWFSVDLSEGDG